MPPTTRADSSQPSPDIPETDLAGGSATTDGRLLRRQRNRDAVVEALLDLYSEGMLSPSTEEIAARSGLSPRSLFRYFDDVGDLTRTAMARQTDRILPLVEIDARPEDDAATKIEVLVEQRFRLFDLFGNAAKVSRLRAPFEPVLAEMLTRNRSFLRSQMEWLFAPELAAMDEDHRLNALGAADILTSFESYNLLTGFGELTSERAQLVMVDSLTAILGSAG
jgi:AcrR family transcriptional regulator